MIQETKGILYTTYCKEEMSVSQTFSLGVTPFLNKVYISIKNYPFYRTISRRKTNANARPIAVFLQKCYKFYICMLAILFVGCMMNGVACGESHNAEEKIMDSENRGYIIATEYMPADGKTDISDTLQQLIYENPNSTIYFPDGVYILAKPVLMPADPKYSVDLQLSNFACLKASDDWDCGEAMLRFGAVYPANDINTPGSNYGINGGIIDGSGKARGISIDGGRETYIRNVNIKNVVVGIHIKSGANNGSSDADISSINIVGNGSTESIGILVEGFDNTFTNIRIANVFTGVDVRSGGNMFRNIHPLFMISADTYASYDMSVGFRVQHPMNWFDYCYSDHFSVGFETTGGGIYKNCFCWWYSDKEENHIAVRSLVPFFGSIDTMMIGGQQHPGHPNRFMENENISDIGVVENIVIISPDGIPSPVK